MIFAFCGQVLAQELRSSDSAFDIPPDFIGYKAGTATQSIDSKAGGDAESVAEKAPPGHVRYPVAVLANSWDWRTGALISELEFGGGSVEPRLDERPQRPADLVEGLAPNTDIVYVLNIAHPTPVTGVSLAYGLGAPESMAILDAKIDDMLAALNAFKLAGRAIERVVIGSPNVGEGPRSIYTANAPRYIRHANRVARSIKGYDSGIEVGVMLESNNGLRTMLPWTQAIHDALNSGALRNIDAVSVQHRPGTHVPVEFQHNDFEQAEAVLALAYRHVSRAMSRDLATLPAGIAVWSDEHVNADDAVQGTWAEALYKAILVTRAMALDERIELVNIATPRVEAVTKESSPDEDPSGNDLIMGMLARALEGRTRLRSLAHDGVDGTSSVAGTPGLSGIRLSGDVGEALVLINATHQPIENLRVRGLLYRGDRHRVEQHTDASPLTLAPDGGPVRYGLGGGLESREWDLPGHTVDLEPFSITMVWSVED